MLFEPPSNPSASKKRKVSRTLSPKEKPKTPKKSPTKKPLPIFGPAPPPNNIKVFSVFATQDPNKAMFEKTDREIARYWDNGFDHNSMDMFMFLSHTSSVYKNYIQQFQNISQSVIRLEHISEGVSGYTKKMSFEVNGREVRTVLKGSIKKSSDNLYWEWKTGLAVNELALTSPIFPYTYGLYLIHNKKLLLDESNKNVTKFSDLLFEYPDQNTPKEPVLSCKLPTRECLMTQYVPVFGNISKYLKQLIELESTNEINSRLIELVGILHMVYASLSLYKDRFTHYDLHTDNVLISQLKGKYVVVEFIHNGKVYQVNTRLFPVIIDYGRSFFDVKGRKSANLLEEICKMGSVCPDKCGDRVGYDSVVLEGSAFMDGDPTFVVSRSSNMSHDMRLIKMTLEYINQSHLNTTIGPAKWFTNIREKKLLHYVAEYGTPPQKSKNDGKIYNVIDLFNSLKEVVTSEEYQLLNKALFMKWKQLGTLTIDLDHQYTPFKWTYNPDY